jgi:SAM-dependent methyltransferase
MNTDTIRADFDRLAPFEDETWGHNNHYHPFLLRHLPPACANALEIGCGTGQFARLLAGRAQHVLALDLSPEMVKIAQSRSADYPYIEYRVADVLSADLPAAHFDCIASIATLHHLPLEAILPQIAAALRPGGVFLGLDLFREATFADYLATLVAIPVNLALRLVKTGRLRTPAAVRSAWDEHGRHDHYLTLAQIRRACAEVIPGVQVTRHLLWRYSLTWRKPSSDSANSR